VSSILSLAILSEAGRVGCMISRGSGSHSTYLRTLDGWRAVSVLGVVYFHCLQNGLKPDTIRAHIALRADAGVDVFFAISGFLICGRLLAELLESKTISLRNFYLRRCFRILPAVWAYLAVLVTLSSLGWVASQGWEFGSTLLFLRNYFPLYHNNGVLGTYTAQFWSLAVEEHFYLLWPMTMLILGPKIGRIGWTALISALCVYVWRVADQSHGWLIPFGTAVTGKSDTRIDALLWGCLAAIVYPYVSTRLKTSRFGRNLWVPVSMAALVAIYVKNIPGFSLIEAVLLPAMIVCTVVFPESLLGRFLELPLLKWIGRLSYSIYIWQQLAEFRTESAGSPLLVLQTFPSNLAVIFLFAACSYYLVERPMVRLGHRLTRPTTLSDVHRAFSELNVTSCSPESLPSGSSSWPADRLPSATPESLSELPGPR
jgi:peptidoglycan/LPS O-acetylase OafA/YrhL